MRKKQKLKAIMVMLMINFTIYGVAYGQYEQWVEETQPGMNKVEEILNKRGYYEEKKGIITIYPTSNETRQEDIKTENTEMIEDTAEEVETHSEGTLQERLVNTPVSEVERKIRKHFPDNADNMIKLFTCESGLEQDKIGDLSLTFEHNGEILGSSHGIAQVRNGGRDNGRIWNRAKANGMTIKERRKIYNARGYQAWYNCGVKTGLIK